ncbi:hypothetical protein LOK49_LG05G01407 [Camellia lanceoleosa]|uniref:Uncharacterized protein n=1 Tax=Camellia lanceoleosa TaxID=1840588 RepID=A0ACC0HS31_9ERIC|nr:hypothetical protein LOK49_LG05G01407 [Camellia lanceoleosa]
MPSIISNELNDTKSIKTSDIRSNGDSTLRKRRLRSDSAAEDGTKSKSLVDASMAASTALKMHFRTMSFNRSPGTLCQIAAASGDMRKALCICRSAIEMLQAELRESACNLDFSLAEKWVRVDHMAIALSKTYRSPIMDTVQSLPQHQQIILCSAVKLFRGGKKDTTIGELSKSYLDICKLTLIPPVGIMELSSMCRVLGDQGLLKLGQSREDKLRRVTLKVDEADVAFALQGIHAF